MLAEAKAALWDPRAASYPMVEETSEGQGRTFRYYTARPPEEGLETFPARTVGEALRYHLWQYEDAGASFEGGFPEWWEGYAPSRGLPVEEAVTAGP